MDFIRFAIDFFVHLDQHLDHILKLYGNWTYLLLFLTIFCETGLVVTPFLPGDSLLFVVGAFAAVGWLDIRLLCILLMIAATAGNIVNYQVGSWIGPVVFTRDYRLLKRKHLQQTHEFFEKYGSKTVIFARFLPMARTIAPFLAGVGRMSYPRFVAYSVIGCVAWVALFLLGGYYFGNIPVVRRNLTLVIFGIIVLSVLPTVFELLRRRLSTSKSDSK